MYLLSQWWLYLLLACLAGLGLGLLLNRICQQRRHAAELAALQTRYRDDRTRVEAAFVGERAELQARLGSVEAEHRVTGERALALSTSVEEHHAARLHLGGEVQTLQGQLASLQAELAQERQAHQGLQTTYESRLGLLNTETSRAVQMGDQLTELQSRHAALEEAHRATLDQQASVAKEAYERLLALQAERDAAREATAATEATLSSERQALEQQRAALQAELAALQDTHASVLTAHEAATAQAAAQARQFAADTASQAAVAQRTAEEALAAAQAERDAAREAAAATEATLSSERQAAVLAAGVAAAAALSGQQSHQNALAALEQERTDLVDQRDRRIAELQAALADQEAAWQTAERQVQDLRDAQAASQSAAQLREQAIQQELGLTQTRTQDLEAELRALRLTLAENDEQLATLGVRLQTERDQQQAAQLRIAELASLVPPPAPELPVVVRPAVSRAASLSGAELEQLVLAAGAGLQPPPVEVDHQRPDDLKIIDGIGPVNERWLHAHGVRYFWQIASWSPAELAWVAHHLPNFGSRVYRENWIAQAAKLAAQQSIR
jgi:predicted flap endonuclease-1-like 5' DNA nuclease